MLGLAAGRASAPQLRKAARKSSLWANLGFRAGSGMSPPAGHVEVVDARCPPPARLRRERHGDVAGVVPAAHAHHAPIAKGQAGQDRDPVVALLACIGEVGVIDGAQALGREAVVRALGFLQAEHVGPRLREEAADVPEAQAHRVDVPGRDGEAHSEVGGTKTAVGSGPQGPALSFQHALVGDGEELRVDAPGAVEVRQGHRGEESLRVDDAPAGQGLDLVVEEQADPRGPAERRAVLQHHAHPVRVAADIDEPVVLGQVDAVPQQEFQGRLADGVQVLGRELAVAHGDGGAVGDHLQGRGRGVLEAQLAGALQVELAAELAAVAADLDEVADERVEAVEVGVGALDDGALRERSGRRSRRGDGGRGCGGATGCAGPVGAGRWAWPGRPAAVAVAWAAGAAA